ncbi:DUF6538 domain-containing protein [Pseudogemmobacter bohemicus]|uniref:DUF6538 domain-containing protein n=1 Tax=Pseudogemmobacter bohemicus TaxID=2250708 RepID=UPI002FCDDE9D
MSIIRRSKIYYIKRRVPVRYQRVEERPWYVASLKTDSLREAEAKAAVVWENCIQGWEARLSGRSYDALARFESARDLAQTRGFAYLPASPLPGARSPNFWTG